MNPSEQSAADKSAMRQEAKVIRADNGWIVKIYPKMILCKDLAEVTDVIDRHLSPPKREEVQGERR